MTAPFIIAFDTETTGADAATAKVCEIAWALLDGDLDVVESGHNLIDPLVPIPPDASGIHHITDFDVEGRSTLEEYMKGWPKVEAPVLVAHNAKYDIQVLDGHLPPHEVLCTLRASRKLFPGAPNHKLQTLRYYLDLVPGGRSLQAHSATGDVEVLVALLRRLVDESQMSVAELVEYAAKPILIEKMGFGKHRGEHLAEIPSSYLRWALANMSDMDDDLRYSMKRVLGVE